MPKDEARVSRLSGEAGLVQNQEREEPGAERERLKAQYDPEV